MLNIIKYENLEIFNLCPIDELSLIDLKHKILDLSNFKYLTKLVINSCLELQTLILPYNLKELDIKRCYKLTKINLSNRIKTLSITKCYRLNSIECSRKLTEFKTDNSKLINLIKTDILSLQNIDYPQINSNIKYLKLDNCKNINLSNFKFDGLYLINCRDIYVINNLNVSSLILKGLPNLFRIDTIKNLRSLSINNLANLQIIERQPNINEFKSYGKFYKICDYLKYNTLDYTKLEDLYMSNIYKDSFKAINTGECIICRDQDQNDNLITTKCNHIYHCKCILKWLKIQKTCPYCRNSLEITETNKLDIKSIMLFYIFLNSPTIVIALEIDKHNISLLYKSLGTILCIIYSLFSLYISYKHYIKLHSILFSEQDYISPKFEYVRRVVYIILIIPALLILNSLFDDMAKDNILSWQVFIIFFSYIIIASATAKIISNTKLVKYIVN
jgi:hypothetical protein